MAKIYKYNGRLYSENYRGSKNKHLFAGDLMDLLIELERDHRDIYSEETITARYVGGEYFGTWEDRSDEETIDNIIENGYGDDIGLEAEEGITDETI